MYVTIDLSDQKAAALKAQALAANMLPENYLRELIDRALHSGHTSPMPEGTAGQSLKPKKSAYGLLAQYGSGPTEAEIDENCKEMFSGFGEIIP